MSQKIKCWFPDEGETEEEDGRLIEAYDAGSAAEKLVERNWEGNQGSEFEVCTRDSFGVLRTFDVFVEAQPVFAATERRHKEKPPHAR